SYIAALDGVTGSATAWNPGANAFVRVLEVSGSGVYAGGDFTSIGGQPRSSVAALNGASGLATAWNPRMNGPVDVLAVSGSTIFAGGGFTSVGGQPRSNIAAIDIATGFPKAWNPGADHAVSALSVSGSTVYAGGQFTSIGGQPRDNIAAASPALGSRSRRGHAQRYSRLGSRRWRSPDRERRAGCGPTSARRRVLFRTDGAQSRTRTIAVVVRGAAQRAGADHAARCARARTGGSGRWRARGGS